MTNQGNRFLDETDSTNKALHVGIWLDLSEALLAIESVLMRKPLEKTKPEVKFITSNIERRCKSTGGRGGHYSYQHTSVRSAARNERRRDGEIQEFLQKVTANLESHPEHKIIASLTLAGPGLAKQRLASILEKRHPEWPKPEIKTTTSRMSEYEKLALLGWPHRRIAANL